MIKGILGIWTEVHDHEIGRIALHFGARPNTIFSVHFVFGKIEDGFKDVYGVWGPI